MGNDVNNCASILTPCQTLAGAAAQVAVGGEVIILNSGDYGPVTITRALTIEAPPGVLGFIQVLLKGVWKGFMRFSGVGVGIWSNRGRSWRRGYERT